MNRVGTILAAMILAAGCGSNNGDSSADTTPSAATTGSADELKELQEILARDELAVAASSFGDGGPSANDVERAFNSIYAADDFGSRATVFSVVVQRSQENRLPQDRRVWMVHVSEVPRSVPPPHAPVDENGVPTGPEGKAEVIETDLFAFFDETSVEHIATVYIGPSRSAPSGQSSP